MCRTVHAVLSTAICGVQMMVRVFMTIILMIENVIRMILQTLYNFISFMLQMLSLIPICIVFLLTARLKCFMCGGGGPCPVNRGGACDCIMSALAIALLFFIFRATGVLDKMFYSIGYAKALPPTPARYVPTPGDITECSRNDTDYTDFTGTTLEQMGEDFTYEETTDDVPVEALVADDTDSDSDSDSGVDSGVEDSNSTDVDSTVLQSTNTRSTFEYLTKGTHQKMTTKIVSKDNVGYDQLTTVITYDPNG